MAACDPPARTCDCLILGGGPAGAGLACLLGATGVHTVLIDHGRALPSGPYESLLPAAEVMLERTGCLDLVRRTAEPDRLRHGAIWGSDDLVWQPARSTGFCLRRPAFDRALRALAAERGVRVHCPAQVRGGLGLATTEGVDVTDAGGATVRYQPKVVVLATGRARMDPTVAARHTAAGPATHAFTLVGTAPQLPVDVAIVEAVADGWLWLQTPTPGTASVGILVDPTPAEPLPQLLRRVLAQSRGPATALRDAPLRHAVDATARCVETDLDVLLVGDAAARIDPLASQGVEKALAAADHAAAIVRTTLDHPALRRELLLEQRRWEHGLFAAHQEQTSAFYREETRFAESPFWLNRRTSAARPAPDPPAEDAVLSVAKGVRATPALRRIGDAFERCDGAEFGDSRITHLGFVPVPPLLQAFATPATLHAAVSRVGRDPRCFVLPQFAVLQALRVLRQRGWLVRAPTAARNP